MPQILVPQILVIDDDPTIGILLKRTLTHSGYEVILANNGEDGLLKAKQFRPALIICDWLMPGIDGLEVCQQVKNTPELSTTFFILLTSLVSVEDRIKGLDAGSDDFLCKPIEMSELQARVRAGLRLHQLSQAIQEQKQLLEAELVEAADYVCSLLPTHLKHPLIEIDIRFIPSRQLGGDGFDYFWLDRDHLVIYLLDVSGHGLRAAFPSIAVINLLRSRGLSHVNYLRPSDVLQGLNKTFQMTQVNDKYFTIWYGVYNCRRRTLAFSSAGHPPALLLSQETDGTIQEKCLKTPGFPIGMFPDSDYTDIICQIQPLSSLYIFSDGIYEINQANGTVWGLPEFIKLLKDYQNKTDHNLDQLLQQVQTFNINIQNQFDDDLSIMEINFH